MLKFFNKSDIHSCVNQKRIDYYNHVYFRRIKTTKTRVSVFGKFNTISGTICKLTWTPYPDSEPINDYSYSLMQRG